MKRFRFRDYSYIKYAFVLLLAAALMNFNVTGFVTSHAVSEKRIIDVTLTSPEVWEFLMAHPGFHVNVSGLSAEEKARLEHEYPALYSGLPDKPLFEVIYYSGSSRIIVITDNERVLKVAA